MRTLIIRPGAIGDSLLTFPVMQRMRAQDSQPRVTLVGNAAVLPLARAFGLAEEVDNYDSPRWSELFSANGVRTPELRDLLQHIDRAICWLSDPDGIVKQNLLAVGVKTVIVTSSRAPEEKRCLHCVEYLAKTVGLPPIDVTAPFVPPTPIPLPSPMRGTASTPVAIHPGSGGEQKCWPVSHFLTLIDRLCSQDQPVLLLAGPADHERLATLLDALAPHYGKQLLQTLVDAPLMEVANRLVQCQCYIGNDAGITHLAALLGLPTIAIFGPSDPTSWRPLGPAVKIVRQQSLERLSVDTIMEALETFSPDRSMTI